MAQVQYKNIDLRGYLDLNKNELRNARIHNLGSDPGSPVEGQALWRTDTHRLRAYNGTAFTDIIAGDYFTAKGDLISASASNTPVRQGVGADGTFLVAASGQASGLQWRVIADTDIPGTLTRDTEVFLLTAYTTKGDIGIATGASTVARHGVGANGTFLVANSANGDGWENRAIVAADIQEKIATADLTDWPRVAALDLNGQKITSLADGTATTDAATWGQVSAILEGKKWKADPAQAATTGVLPNTPTYNSGAGTLTSATNVALAAQDGITLALNDTLLVKNQASSFQDGIYTLTQVGTGSVPWILTRRADANVFGELQNQTTIYITGGTTQGGDIYTQTATIANLTADAQTWTKTGDTNTVYTADGTTITLTGTQFSVTTGGILNAQVGAGAAIVYSKLSLTNSIVNADIASAAAIAYSKLALTNSIVNADIAAGAAIAYSKLNLATSIVNADIAAGAAIAYSKLALSNSIVNADINSAAAIAYSKLNLAGAVLAADINGTAVASGSGVVRVGRVYSQSITGGATTEVVTHGLGTRDVQVALINNATPWDAVEVEWAATSTTTITLSSPVNLPASYRVVVTA